VVQERWREGGGEKEKNRSPNLYAIMTCRKGEGGESGSNGTYTNCFVTQASTPEFEAEKANQKRKEERPFSKVGD